MVKRIDRATEEKIIEMYQDGYGCIKIAKKLSINRVTAQRYLKTNRIQLRQSRSPTYDYNMWFF